MKMNYKILCLLVLWAFTLLQGQNSAVKIKIDGKVSEISSLNRKGTDYVSARQIAEALEAPVFYNSSTAKLEIRFPGKFAKITGRNQFIVVTGQEGQPLIYQLPVSTLHAREDILIPLEYSLPALSKASGRKIEITGRTNASVSNESKGIENKTDAKKKQETASASLPSGGAVAATVPSAENSAEKKSQTYDITGLTVDVKANGTMVRIRAGKAITRYSSSVSKGVLYVNIAGLSADEKALRLSEPKGLIKKVVTKKAGNNIQLAFHLDAGYSTTEAIPDGNDLLITIHNKMLSGAGSASSKQIGRWELNTVVIDAGHGGKDPGAIGVNGVKEKDINLSIALRLGSLIEENMPGVKVVYTRSGDKFVELYRRGKIANEHNGNLFISIHCNSTAVKPTNRSGFEVYLLRPGRTKEAISIASVENSVIKYEDNPSRYKELTDENFILVTMAHSSYMRYSEHFSEILNRQFTNDLELPSNGVKQAGFYVLVGASMPSVLVEAGFLSNKHDAAYLSGKSGQKEIASSIYKSVKTFKEEYEKSLKAQL